MTGTFVRASIATESGRPDRANEDFAAIAPGALVLLDGAGAPARLESGCVHSVAWYARNLGGLLTASVVDRERTLIDALASSIEAVNALHVGRCDLGHESSPSATVVVARVVGERLEYLVLADSVLAIERTSSEPLILSDDRLAQVQATLDDHEARAGMRIEQRADHLLVHMQGLGGYRNQPGGFWVASTKPEAAEQALTGSVPLAEVSAVTLLSDGASRLVDRFGLLSWAEALAVLRKEGPEALIARTREAESDDPDGVRWPRSKRSDDATVLRARPGSGGRVG